MTKGNITADEIRHAIVGRISSGAYPVGAPLPSHRRLAEELGANRNTIQKACRSLLELGILETLPGRRVPVVRRVPESAGVIEVLRERAGAAIWAAMAAGVSREHALAEMQALVDQVYVSANIRIRFLECNRYDSHTLADELARMVELPVAAGLVADLDVAAESVAQRHDLIVTTFHHLAEVSRALSSHREKVVGIDTRPSPDTVLGIARLTQPHIGLICTLADTAQMLRHVVLSYQPGHHVETALIGVPEDVRRVAAECDHLLVTHNCLDDLAALVDRAPDVVIEFRVDAQSISYLRDRITAIRRGTGH